MRISCSPELRYYVAGLIMPDERLEQSKITAVKIRWRRS